MTFEEALENKEYGSELDSMRAIIDKKVCMNINCQDCIAYGKCPSKEDCVGGVRHCVHSSETVRLVPNLSRKDAIRVMKWASLSLDDKDDKDGEV